RPSRARGGLSSEHNPATVEKTNAEACARPAPPPPLPHGVHRVAVRFQGDELDMGSGLRVNTHIVNSRGRVQSHGMLKLSAGRRVGFSASSDGKLASGTVVLRLAGEHRVRAVAVGELGVAGNSAEAWLRGNDRQKRRYLIHLERIPGQHAVRIEIVGGTNIVATVPAQRLSFGRS